MDARLQEEIRQEAAKSGISEAMAWHVVMTREIQAGRIVPLSAEGFDPNQPRDEDGKWTTSGGATVSTRALGRERRIDSVEDNEWSWTPGMSPDDDGNTTHKPTGERAINVYGKIKRSKDRGASYSGDLDEPTTSRYRSFHEQVKEAKKTLSDRNMAAIKAANPEPPRRYPEDEKKARRWDRGMNEGGEGYNPYR
jgi:hypothetical protein